VRTMRLKQHGTVRSRSRHEARTSSHSRAGDDPRPQTKVAHRQLARDEAVQRMDGEKQVAERALQSVQDNCPPAGFLRNADQKERHRAIKPARRT